MNNYIWFIVLAAVIASFSQVLLKKSAAKHYENFISEYLNRFTIVGYSMMVVSTILPIIAYAHIDYKNGPTAESVSYIFVMVLSRIFFEEKITLHKLVGNIMILFGIAVFYL